MQCDSPQLTIRANLAMNCGSSFMNDVAKKNQQIDLSGRMELFKGGSSDVFDKAYRFVEADMIRQFGIYPYYQTIDRNEGAEAIIEGKTVIMLGSNNYLGLTIHPEVREAACEAIRKYGTSLTGSRLLNGTHVLHEKLEKALSDFFGTESCLVFATGYQANLGVLTALMTENSITILDKANHASIYDAARLAKGRVEYFRHNDTQDLERLLKTLPDDVGKLIVVDGVFSMEGDVADLPALVSLAKKYRCRLVVDDAHGVGIIGTGGRGTVSHYQLEGDVDLIIGTFSKSLASVGGFVVGPEKVIDFIRHFGRSILFSASLPPASVAAAHQALDILQREPERVQRVQQNGHYMRENLRAMGFDTGLSTTPVIPIMIGDEVKGLTMWRELLNEGVYVNAVLYPAVPRDRAMLRTSYTSEHTRDHLDRALAIFKKIKTKHNL